MLPLAQRDCSIFFLSRKGLILAERTKMIRPDYVARFEDAEHQASYIKGHWYLYEKMPNGKSHKYIGRINEDGVCLGKHRSVHQKEEIPPAPIILNPLSTVVREYGFSKAVLALCPESWKAQAGKRWRDILIEIIIEQSPHSYLNSERNPSKLRVHIGNQRRFLQNQMGLQIKELWDILGNIYWVQDGDHNGFSFLNSEQAAFCQEHLIHLEVLS